MDPPNNGRYMDDDSGSPTQVNEGRSYDRYAEAPELPSMPLQGPDEAHDHDQSRLEGLNDLLDRSLDENDTGAVHFDSLDSGGLDFESPSMNNDGRRTDRPMTRFFFPNSDNEPPLAPATTGLETPAPPKNPFAAAKNMQTPLLGGTQLFAQTPLSAAAGKPVSPTSSRPSPSHPLAAMPYAGVSSPLKLHFLASDNDETTTPAPNLSVLLATSSQSRFDATTPFPADRARSAPGPLSSPSIHRRTRRQIQARTPTLLAEYEPMRQSQARRNAAELQPEPVNQDFGASSSEDDIEDASQRRRRIVRRKREEGAKALSSINIAGPSFRQDNVEVPASTKKEGCEQRPRSKGGPAKPCAPKALRQDNELQHRNTMRDTKEQNPVTEAPPSGSETTYGDVSFPQSLIDAFNTRTDAPPAVKTPTSSAVSLPEMGPPGDQAAESRPLLSSLNRAEAIPETSPATTRQKDAATAIVICSVANDSSQANEGKSHEPDLIVPASDDVQQHDLLPQRRTSRSRSPREQQQKHNLANPDSSWRSGLVQDSEADGTTSSPPVLAATAFDTRPHRMQRRGDATGQTPARPRAAGAASTSSSDTGGTASNLSSLSATPTPPSREGTPTTVNDSDMSALGSEEKKLVDSVEQQDEVIPHTRRSRRQHSATASLLQEPASKKLSLAALASTRRRASPFLSGTVSNRSASPATALAPEQSMCTGRRSVVRSMASHKAISSSSFISTRRQSSAVPGVFTGMAFAISFQSRRTRGPEKETDKEFYDREQQSKVLGKRIQEAGGRILEDGFAELFNAPPVGAAGDDDDDNDATGHALQLRATAAATGFTVLIADGHSRKTKYMQALALGLPCLAARWVTTCLELNTLVDWSPYLLCAGQSSFLGGAFCSQKVVPYDAATARLANVVNSGCNSSGDGGARRLMEGMSVLLVLLRSSNGRGAQNQQPYQQQQKEEENRTAPYIFLTHVLGARLSRVYGADEARRALLAMEQAGRPFDWVYTDGEGDNGAYFDAAAQLDELPVKVKSKSKMLAGSKRKRAAGGRSGNNATSAPVPRPVKLLSNERVIQSLIFGKFIEQDQLGA